MIYKVRHLTAYSYEAPVASATLALRLTPRTDRWQHVNNHKIDISPKPDANRREMDFYGNAVNVVTINTSHTKLSITSTAELEVNHQPTLLGPDLAWETVANEAAFGRDLSSAAPAHFLFTSPRIALSSEVTRYARQSFPPGRGIIEGCHELMTRIRDEFAYKPSTTEIDTPLTEAFAKRRGVCQDFAHIMIAGLRGLSLPAAYVSGYLRTVPPPGKKKLQGADATHAWVSVWTGPHHGWIGFDPTNAMQTGNDHITLAVGRDFSDVSPVYGVFVGSGKTKLKVEVDVTPMTAARAVS